MTVKRKRKDSWSWECHMQFRIRSVEVGEKEPRGETSFGGRDGTKQERERIREGKE